MDKLPNCPQCKCEYTYEDRGKYICPECAHEWTETVEAEPAEKVVTDAFGNVLVNGDTITVIKSLKVKGSSGIVKIGTKIKGIRIVDGVDDHNIDCRIDGIGSMMLKSEFVKKV